MKTQTSENVRKNRVSPVTRIYKKRQAYLFAFWLTTPRLTRGLTIAEKLKVMDYNSEDNKLMEILGCKSRIEVASVIGVSSKQLGIWERSPEFQKMCDGMHKESNVMKFKKDIDFSFTQKTIKEADAARVMAWKKIYENFKVGADTQTPELVEAIRDNIRETRKIFELSKQQKSSPKS